MWHLFLWLTQNHATLHSWYHPGSGDVSCAGDSHWATVIELRLRKSWGTVQRNPTSHPHPVFMVVQVSVASLILGWGVKMVMACPWVCCYFQLCSIPRHSDPALPFFPAPSWCEPLAIVCAPLPCLLLSLCAVCSQVQQ